MLIPRLEPIGDYRREHVCRSRGRGRGRNAKSKVTSETRVDPGSPPKWMPEVFDCLTIGFNSTVRRLEAVAERRRPALLPNSHTPTSRAAVPHDDMAALSVVLVCRSSLPDIMTSCLPLLVTMGSAEGSWTRLLGISAQAESMIAKALDQPRVGVLGVEEDAPGFQTLNEFVREVVAAVEVPWLQTGSQPTYLPVNVRTAQVIPRNKTKKRKRKNSVPR